MGDRGRHGEMQPQREDAGARSKVRQHREVVPPSFTANNRSRTAELTAQVPPQLQLQPIEGARGPWGWPRAPRGLCLRRRENGFGFTLRHFIVYPPESYTILQSNRRLWGGVLSPGSGLKSLDEPMDTIFVKNVKENSPAHAAGLSTGDRIISVNGETIGGKSYAEVVQLIQQSTKFLHLLVVPKEDDILQLYFADTAHNPETNQRPSAPSSMRSPEAMLRSSVHRHQHQQQHQQQFSHLPKPRPYRPSAGEAAAQAPTSPRCLSGSGAVVSAPSSLPDAAVYQQNQSQQPHSWHLVARAQPVVTRRSSDANLRIKEVDNYCDPYQVEEHEEHRRRISGSSGWSSDSAGVRSSIPGASFSPRPLHSPPSFCSVDGSEGTLTHDSNGSLHSLPTSYGSPFCSLDPRRRDSTVSLPPTMRCDGFRDAGPPPAASPGGSGACYPEDDEESAVTDSVMRRIRKSFEQKEEFLRRPTQPIWLPQPTAAIPREFYAHPQKFQRPPWPPHQLNGGDVDESPSSPSKQTGGTSSPVSATRKGTAEVADAGSQHGRSRHPGKPFVTTLTRITENLPAAGGVPGAASATPPQSPPPALQLVSRRARQFESGEVVEEGETVVDKTNFYRSELSRLSSKRSVPNVAVRKREFETRGKESRSFDGPGLQHSGAANSSGGGGGGSTGESPCPPSPAPRTPSPKPSLNVAFCGNRLTPVGGGWLHCEPPPDLFEQQTPTPEELPAAPSPPDQRRRSRSNSADDSWASGATSAWVQKHHAQPVAKQQQAQQSSQQQQQQAAQQQQAPTQKQHVPEKWRQGESVAATDTSPNAGRRLVRQHSYLAAVKKPINAGHFAMQEDGDSEDDCWGRERGSEEPKRRPQALRPTHLDIPHPIRPASLHAPPSPDEDAGGDSSTTAGTPTSFPPAPAAPASTPEEGVTPFIGGGRQYLAAPTQELESTTTGAQPYGNRSPALQTAPTRSSPAVIRRQKTASQIEDEGERVVRRVSYLKATWGDRMHVDSDLELSDGEQASSGLLRPQDLDQSSRSSSVVTLPLRPFCQNPSLPLPYPPLWGHTKRLKSLFEEKIAAFSSGNRFLHQRTSHTPSQGSTTSDAVMISGIPQPSSATSASARQPHGILRLRSLFTDKQHHHQDATANANAAANLHSGSNKENQQVVKEGWLQCKFTVAEGKRSADRSWKQVKAVLRGSYLHLIKDRKEALAAPQQTPGMTLGHSPASQTGSAATLNSSTGTAGTTTSSSSCSSSSEEVVDVRNGVVDVAEDYTKRKHVFRLSAGPGGPGSHSSEVLLQAEDSIDMLQWIRALQESGCQPEGHAQIVANDKEHSTEATTNGSSMPQGSASAMQGVNSAQSVGTINPACAGSSAATSPYVNRLSPLPAHKGIRKLTSLRNRSPTGQSPVNKTRKASQGDQLPSPKSKTWKGRVAKQFRRIQHGGGASSPSSPTAPRPEGVTIGVPLEDCPPSTNHPFVPLLVELCTSIVEAKGLDIIGIYRVPGNTAAVASLTEGVNRGFDCINMQFLMQDARWNDVNVISSLLKLFFRRLPDSLLTSYLYPLFIESDKIEEPERRIATIRKLVRDLPDHHYETLKHLIFHLKKVVSHCNVNKMEARNLAIVFGPTLVRTDDDNMVTMVTDMSHQCRIVETLISHVDWFFSEEDTDDLSSIPFDVCAEAGENDTTGANQNLLLNNIQKVEGMKVESPSKEISAKDIVSSIISAANRKMQKAKGRKGGGSGGGGGGGGGGVVGQEDFAECTSDHRDGDKQGCDKHRPIEETGQQSRGQGDVRDGPEGSNSVRHRSSSEDHTQQRVSVASSILGSVIFSGNIVKSIHEADVSSQSNPEEHSEVVSPTNHEEEPSPSPHLDHRGPPYNAGPPLDLGGTIRTYAGLSATTQERIRRFELETRAMLQRDIAAKQRNSETESLLHSAVERTSESISHHSKDSYNSGTIFIKPMAHTSDESSSPEVSRSLLSAPVHSTLSRPRLHSHPNHHQRNSSPSSRQSALCPNNSPSSLGTQSVLRDSGNILPPAGDKVNYSEEGAPIGNLRRGNSAENLARQTVVQGQRLLVSEHLSFDGHKIAPNGTLKRLKTECEQPQLSSEDGAIRLPPTPNAMRRGSLDSLQEAYGQEGRDRPSSDVSDDGSDLLASLTSTFDKKLRSLLGPGASHSSGEQHSAQGSPRELHPEEAESTTPEQSRTSAPNSSSEESNQRLSERIGATTQKDPDKWSAKKEKEVTVEGMEEKVARGGNDRRSKNSVTVETTPPAETVESKPRRTDSLSKTEKTEANTKTKDGERQWRRREAGTKRGGGDDEAKLKRKNGMPDRSIKRRHTVGGTKDFDKIEWAVTNGREGDRSNNSALPDEKERGTADGEGEVGLRAWVGRERLRTSSPDLGCRRALGSSFVVEINVLLPGAVVGRCGVVRGDGGPGGGVGARPHGLPTTRVHEQPLESHV